MRLLQVTAINYSFFILNSSFSLGSRVADARRELHRYKDGAVLYNKDGVCLKYRLTENLPPLDDDGDSEIEV